MSLPALRDRAADGVHARLQRDSALIRDQKLVTASAPAIPHRRELGSGRFGPALNLHRRLALARQLRPFRPARRLAIQALEIRLDLPGKSTQCRGGVVHRADAFAHPRVRVDQLHIPHTRKRVVALFERMQLRGQSRVVQPIGQGLPVRGVAQRCRDLAEHGAGAPQIGDDVVQGGGARGARREQTRRTRCRWRDAGCRLGRMQRRRGAGDRRHQRQRQQPRAGQCAAE